MPDAKTTKPTAPTPAKPSPPAPPPSSLVAVAAQAQQTLDLLNKRLTDIDARLASSATASLTLAQSLQAKTVSEGSTKLNTQLPIMITSLQTAIGTTQTNQTSRTQALSSVRAGLQSVIRKPPQK